MQCFSFRHLSWSYLLFYFVLDFLIMTQGNYFESAQVDSNKLGLSGNKTRIIYIARAKSSLYLVVNGIKRHIPDVETLAHLGYTFEDTESVSMDELNSYPSGPEIGSYTREHETLAKRRGGCPCTPDRTDSPKPLPGDNHTSTIICVITHEHNKFRHDFTGFDDFKFIDETDISNRQVLHKLGCSVLARMNEYTQLTFASIISLQCPGVCSPIPLMDVPNNIDILTPTSRITCSSLLGFEAYKYYGVSKSFTDLFKDKQKNKLEGLVLVIRMMAYRRLQECKEKSYWHSFHPPFAGRGGSKSKDTSSTNYGMNERIKIGGLIVYIGSLSRMDIALQQLHSLSIQKMALSLNTSALYRELPLIGWIASEDEYPCRAGTTRCEDLNERRHHQKYIPFSEMDHKSDGWNCAQRRPLRALAHSLLLFNPGFVLMVDDDTFVNTNYLLPNGKMYDYIHIYMAKENVVISELLAAWGYLSVEGFMLGGAGYLMGRAALDRLESKRLFGPANYSDIHRTEPQMLTLSMLRLAHFMSSRHCPTCIQLHRYEEIGSVADMAVRVIDICANILSGEKTCYHSDHAVSRCILHAAYSTIVHADSYKGSELPGLPNLRIGMCQEPFFCDPSFHLTCHRYMPSPDNPLIPVDAKTRPKRVIRGNSSVVYLVDENLVKRTIPDVTTFTFLGFESKDVTQVPEDALKSLVTGPQIRAVLGEAQLITGERGGCPCTRAVELYQPHDQQEGQSENANICILKQTSFTKESDLLSRYQDFRFISEEDAKRREELRKNECSVVVHIRNHTAASFTETVALQCPGKCLPVPYFEVPADLSVLSRHQQAACSITHGAALLEIQSCGNHDMLANFIRLLTKRRIEECLEHTLWPIDKPQKCTGKLIKSTRSNKYLRNVSTSSEPVVKRMKVGGLIIWIGSKSRNNVGLHQLKYLSRQQTITPHQPTTSAHQQTEKIPYLEPYSRLPLVGWHATEVVYPCQANTTRCENLNDVKLYHRYMPSSELDHMSPEWSCMQRRTLRSLAHLLLLFDPGFVLIVDETTYVNVKMLIPGGTLHQYIHEYLDTENKVLNGMHKSRTVTKQGYFNGGTGYLFGRGVLNLIESTTLSGPTEKHDAQRTELQMQRLSVLRLASSMAWRTCPWCVRLHGRDMDCQETGSVGTLAVRLVDICANLLSGTKTCYHGDHAMSRCLFHGSYSEGVNADCLKGSKLQGYLGARVAMCANENVKCDPTFHLTCKHYIPAYDNIDTPVLVLYT